MFRNREIRAMALCLAAIAAVAILAGFAIGPAAGALALLSSAAFCAAFFVFTRARYREIARLSNQIDRVLHCDDAVFISEGEEGELSILQSEITKMTVRIREQNDALRREKAHLADSLADIAHQLRTPLTSVGLTLTLLRDCQDAGERRALLRETEALLMRMDGLITALLKLSRLDAGIVEFRKERVEVADLVRDALRPLQIPMELHGISLDVRVPEGAVIEGDPEWLSEAFQNIVKNCMEGAGDQGRIEITCTDNPLYVEVDVHDSGPGFSEEDLPRVFERYYRGKSADAAGYGIGLSLCRTVITRQGGTIAARNHPRGGALFAVRFSK